MLNTLLHYYLVKCKIVKSDCRMVLSNSDKNFVYS